MTVVLSREDGFITSPVLDQQEKQVVRSSDWLGFRRGVQPELNLQFAVDILHSYISVRYKNSVRRGSTYLDDLVCIIRVHERTINTAIEHLKIPPVLIERLSLVGRNEICR
jgi:hypothetical protein